MTSDEERKRIHAGLALWRDLDINPETDRDRVWTQSGPAEQFGMDWRGWHLAFLCMTTDLDAAAAEQATDRPRMIFETPKGRYLGCVELRLQRANLDGNPLTAERRWTPMLGRRDSIVHDRDHTRESGQFEEIDRAFDLFDQLPLKQSPGPTRMTRDQARESLLNAAISLAAVDKKASYRTLSEELVIDEKTVGWRLNRAEWGIRNVNEHPKVLAARRNR